MQVAAVDTGPAQVIRDPFGLDARGEPLQRREVLGVERVGTADRERYAVHDHRVVLADPIEVVQRLAPVHEVVLADDLEPVHGWPLFEHRRVVIRPQPQTEAEEGPLAGCVGVRISQRSERRAHRWGTDLRSKRNSEGDWSSCFTVGCSCRIQVSSAKASRDRGANRALPAWSEAGRGAPRFAPYVPAGGLSSPRPCRRPRCTLPRCRA